MNRPINLYDYIPVHTYLYSVSVWRSEILGNTLCKTSPYMQAILYSSTDNINAKIVVNEKSIWWCVCNKGSFWFLAVVTSSSCLVASRSIPMAVLSGALNFSSVIYELFHYPVRKWIRWWSETARVNKSLGKEEGTSHFGWKVSGNNKLKFIL